MAISFSKREKEKQKQSKRIEKQKRKEERKAAGGGSFDDMIAYVDENGVITSTPPDLNKKMEVNIENIEVSTPKREESEDPILRGRVEHFNQEKGYGFIKDICSTDKYFFHVSSAYATIAQGDNVVFELERGAKGLNAIKIIANNRDNQ